MKLPDDQIKAFLDAAPDAIVVVDATGDIAFVNVEAEAMFERSRRELVGQPVDALLPRRFHQRHGDHVMRYVVAPRRRPMGMGLELYAMRRDGTEFPVEISLSPVETEQGRFVCSAIRDITERRDAERKLIEAREAAEHANLAKSAFLAAASHDLRQPLQTLSLLNSVLGRLVGEDSRAVAAVDSQSEALRLMSALLNSLLDISKLEAGAVKPDISDCPVRSIFSRLRVEFAALAEAKGLELIVEDCDDVIRTDPALLGQIIQNLLANAIRYTGEGSVRLRRLAGPETVRIEVVDTGMGIAANELERIFDEFYQVPNRGEARDGLGLGLSIVRRMANLLDCPLDVKSAVGRGSCFSVEVPRAGVRRLAHERPKLKLVRSAPRQGRILVVDDDPAVADAAAMLLRTQGLEVVAAGDGAQARRRLLTERWRPDLIICDYHLGGNETGIDAIRAVRAVTEPGLPAVLLSGDTSAAIAETLKGMDGCRLLSKPVDGDELLEVVERLLRSRTPEDSARA